MKKKKQTSKYILYMLIVMMLFTITIYNNSNANTNNASALTYSNNVDLEYTFATTLDVAFSTNTGFVIEELAPGTAAYSNTVTVTASSNSADGFTMSATAGNSSDANRNNNRLVNSDNTNYFESVATNANIALESLGTDKWGYSVYDAGTSTWSNYNGLPAVGSTGTPLADMDEAGSTSVDMRIGASSTNTQVSGTFTNNINFTITAKVVTYDYTITYNANDGDNGSSVSNMPSNASGSLETGDVLLTSTDIPVRDGYTFAGWCDGTVTNTVCDSNTYQVNDNIKIANASSATSNSIDLTAIWYAKYLQTITLAECQTRATDEPITIYDKRDNTSYRIAKLADNKCWMLDNLALDLTALTQAELYGTGSDAGKMTNASNEALGYLKGTTTGTATDKWAMAAVKKTWTSSYSYSEPWIAVDSTTSGGCNSAYCVDGGAAGSPWSYDSETSETINGKTSIAQGKIGVYYNYCAASAGSYCWGGTGTSYAGSPSTDPVPDSIRDITDDICPYGWRLPTGGSTGEFQNLYAQYANGGPNQVTAFQTALSTPLSGYFYSGEAHQQGNRGNFCSSTWEATRNMYFLLVDSSNVNPSNYGYRNYGRSVRCILAE